MIPFYRKLWGRIHLSIPRRTHLRKRGRGEHRMSQLILQIFACGWGCMFIKILFLANQLLYTNHVLFQKYDYALQLVTLSNIENILALGE